MRQQRLEEVQRFYALMTELEKKCGGMRTLAASNGRMNWPQRGVYFFFETGEARSVSGSGPRVVSIGTHALKAGGKTSLWTRLRTHKGREGGTCPGGGNHRGSVFRLHVGAALIARDDWDAGIAGQWGIGANTPREVRQRE